MKLLLHVCCGPCGIYPFKELLRSPADKISGFYFNPNIHPDAEYLKRRSGLEEYSKENNLDIIYPRYDPSDFFAQVPRDEAAPKRCISCWTMRLRKTAEAAREKGFDSFSTTLLISPYQDHLAIKEIGERLARETGIKFYYMDFRPGFRESQAEAKRLNLYRQKYCGCKYSLLEKDSKKITQISKKDYTDKIVKQKSV